MKKTILLLALFSLTLCAAVRIPFNKWPQEKIKKGRVLIAEDDLAHQGFAGAKAKDFKNTLMFFPDVSEGTVFVNVDQGYGPVIKDLDVIFLDKNWKVLKIDRMKKLTGTCIAPLETVSALECTPEFAKKLKFKEGKKSPVKVNSV